MSDIDDDISRSQSSNQQSLHNTQNNAMNDIGNNQNDDLDIDNNEHNENKNDNIQLQQKQINDDNIDNIKSGAYGKFIRRKSISTSDIPHSLQILTPQHQSRPKDDILSQISDMGFSRDSAEKAYDNLLNEYNGDHTAFTTEQVIEMMLIEQDINDVNIVINDNQQQEQQEEEEEEITAATAANNDNNAQHGINKTGDNLIECPICRMDMYPSEMYSTSCLHNYCIKCLEKHYRGSIENGVISFKCMDDQCLRNINETELYIFLEETHKQKYKKFIRNVKLAKDKTIRWCVKPECDTPIKRKSKKDIKLKCPKCSTFVCYNCAGLYYNNNNNTQHDCNKNLDDKLISWAKNSTYDVSFCPKCLAKIEKLSGCNHMQCSYCKYQFCWLCRREFKKGHYNPSNVLFGCPNGENANKKPNRCNALCILMKSCLLMCCLPIRICWWRMNEQGLPWCCCWCCCDD